MKKLIISVVFMATTLLNVCTASERKRPIETYDEWFARQPEDLKIAYKRLDEKGIEFSFEHEPVVRKERHQVKCERIRDKLKQCIDDKKYKGKFTISITNPEWDNFYDEVVNGESDKTTLTAEEIKSMHDNIYEYITGANIYGVIKIKYMDNQLFDGLWTTTDY